MNKTFKQLRAESSLDKDQKTLIRGHLVSFIASNNQSAQKTQQSYPLFNNPFRMFNTKPIVASIVSLALVFTLSGGTVYASQDSLPGEALYKVKIASEKTRTAVTRDPKNKAELHLKYAQRRARELQKLISAGSVTPELVEETEELLFDLMEDVTKMAKTISNEDTESAADVAVRANKVSDEYVETLKDVNPKDRGELKEVAQRVAHQNEKHDENLMEVLFEAYDKDSSNARVKAQLVEELKKDLEQEKEYISMLEGAINFAGTVDKASAKMADQVKEELEKAKKLAAERARLLSEPNFDPNNITEAFEYGEEMEGLEKAFREVESHFEDKQYDNLEYSGPWIDEGADDYTAHSVQGDCHTINDKTVECFEKGKWVDYNKERFVNTILPAGNHQFDNDKDEDNWKSDDCPDGQCEDDGMVKDNMDENNECPDGKCEDDGQIYDNVKGEDECPDGQCEDDGEYSESIPSENEKEDGFWGRFFGGDDKNDNENEQGNNQWENDNQNEGQDNWDNESGNENENPESGMNKENSNEGDREGQDDWVSNEGDNDFGPRDGNKGFDEGSNGGGQGDEGGQDDQGGEF